MKLTKQQRKLHDRAVELIHSYAPGEHRKQRLKCACGAADRPDDRGCVECDDGWVTVLKFIYDHFHPGALGRTDIAATYFTPYHDARSVIEAGGIAGKILEPSAGIGVLADAVRRWNNPWQSPPGFAPKDHVTCVEIIPEFVEIGKRLVPEAEWIQGNVFDVLPRLGQFDYACGNPPFGNTPTNQSPHFKSRIEFGILSAVAPHLKYGGAFILPAGSHGYSNGDGFASGNRPPYQQFRQRHPQWELAPTSWGLSNQWKATQIRCEIVELTLDEDFDPADHTEPVQTPAPIVAALPELKTYPRRARPVDAWAEL